jgi:hypothetical protein
MTEDFSTSFASNRGSNAWGGVKESADAGNYDVKQVNDAYESAKAASAFDWSSSEAAAGCFWSHSVCLIAPRL